MATKHSTFYKDKKGVKQVYTTIKNTSMHEHLRSTGGSTYEHEPNAKLFFMVGMPLDKPLTIIKQVF